MKTSRGTLHSLAAGAGLVLVGVVALGAAQPAQAIPVPECNGFSEAFAASLGYDTHVLPAGGGVYNFAANPNPDWVLGSSAADDITTGGGDDMVCGRGGNDIITTNGGYDHAFGDAGDDTIDLGSGSLDYAEGNGGVDDIDGGQGDDVIFGDGQQPKANDAGDVIQGGPDHDELYGGGADDEISGGQDDDDLFGDVGVDDLTGGPGNDSADGGIDVDVDTCNAETVVNCP